MCKIRKCTFQKVYGRNYFKIAGTNNYNVIDIFYKTKSLPLIEKKKKKKKKKKKSRNYQILMKFSEKNFDFFQVT